MSVAREVNMFLWQGRLMCVCGKGGSCVCLWQKTVNVYLAKLITLPSVEAGIQLELSVQFLVFTIF